MSSVDITRLQLRKELAVKIYLFKSLVLAALNEPNQIVWAGFSGVDVQIIIGS